MGNLRSLVFLLTVFLPSMLAAGEPPHINLPDFPDGDVTGSKYSYLIDLTGAMTSDDAIASDEWLSGADTKTVKIISRGAVWMRLHIDNPSQSDMEIKFEHTESRINKISLFTPEAHSQAYTIHAQFNQFGPVNDRPYPHHRAVFPLKIAANKSEDILFKLEFLPDVRAAIYTEFRIWKSYAFEKSHNNESTLLMLFFSIHMLMGLVTLAIYIVNRDLILLLYSFYAFATIGTRAATNGMLAYAVYTDGIALTEITAPIAIYQMTLLLFAREFLHAKKMTPRWDVVLKSIMLFSLFAIISALTGHGAYVPLITELISASYPVILIISLLCWRRGVKDALIFSFGWAILALGGMITFAARDYGIIEHAQWSYWFAHAGALIVACLLSGLLFFRMVEMRHAKDFIEHKYREHLRTYSEELKLKVEQQTKELKLAKETAEREARTDVLTGLTNRRYFMENSRLAIERSQRNKSSIWLATIDIDFFKKINDTYGHAAGDVALQAVAAQLTAKIRLVDIVARLGGEEFGLIIGGGTQEEAWQVCERLREMIAQNSICYNHFVFSLSISIGLAKKRKDESLDQLIKRSDNALYEAKANGRNCVVSSL